MVALAVLTAGLVGSVAVAPSSVAQTGGSSLCKLSAPATALLLARGSLVAYSRRHPNGLVVHSHRVALQHVAFYTVRGATAGVRFGPVAYQVSRGTTFALGCYGDAAGQPTSHPSLRMLVGRIAVLSPAYKNAGVDTMEALVTTDYDRSRTSYVVTRKTNQAHPSYASVMHWFLGYSNQPAGTTTMTSGRGVITRVTPYVGPRIGSCRHVHWAQLHTIGWHKGTAHYR
ncbi:MAG: hypothetical protein ACRDP1_14745 [Nocardioidaceae bacterium]